MEPNTDNTNQPPRPATSSEKLEIVKILALAVVSFVAGFALIFFLLRPDTPAPAESETAPAPAATPAPVAPPPDTAPAVADTGASNAAAQAPADTAQDSEASAGAQTEPVVDSGSAVAEVPPGKTPDNIAIDGDPFYLKCWDDGGVEHISKDCDRLDVLEKRFASRLYVIDKCRADAAPGSTTGKLSVAAEIDFTKQKISFWNGASSDIANAAAIGTCMRTALAGLPIHGIDHKYARYRIFHTVLFGKTAARKEAPAAVAEDAKPAAPAGDKRKGRMMDVKKDNVRVRKTPVDGEVIGKIGTGNQVKLIGQKNGWCNIITPNNNEGWMICDAIGL